LWGYWGVVTGFGFLMAAGIIFAEVITDQGVFNGIHAKRGYKLDFLKTSPLGEKILFYGLTGDMVRRLLTAAVCIGIARAVKVLAAESGWAGCLGMTLAIYVVEVLGIFISRFTRSVILCLFTAYGCILAGWGLFGLIGILSAPGLWVMDGLLAVATAVLSLLVVRTGMKKWRRTFSDMQENEVKS
ncbi:MAG: hypothetical protein K2K19_11895, partial [Acetatifactor sp.]|nr:hypothetical protein [Acetatifactor sp.]